MPPSIRRQSLESKINSIFGALSRFDFTRAWPPSSWTLGSQSLKLHSKPCSPSPTASSPYVHGEFLSVSLNASQIGVLHPSRAARGVPVPSTCLHAAPQTAKVCSQTEPQHGVPDLNPPQALSHKLCIVCGYWTPNIPQNSGAYLSSTSAYIMRHNLVNMPYSVCMRIVL